jgi:hypothetical protein
MASVTTEYTRRMLGVPDNVPDARLELILETARQHVRRDGIAENHEGFADLQCYFAAYILEKSGAITSVVSRSVGDVSTTFGQGAQVSSWLDLYRMLKTNIIGISGRIA